MNRKPKKADMCILAAETIGTSNKWATKGLHSLIVLAVISSDGAGGALIGAPSDSSAAPSLQG